MPRPKPKFKKGAIVTAGKPSVGIENGVAHDLPHTHFYRVVRAYWDERPGNYAHGFIYDLKSLDPNYLDSTHVEERDITNATA